MKKVILTIFIIILFLPVSVLAYSKFIIPGGESIGIKIESNGLIVVGFYKVGGNYIAKNNIKVGDKITEINGTKVNSIEELTNIIDESVVNSKSVDISLLRNNKVVNTSLELKEEDGIYKTGLYVKDSVIGLGTLTYIDPITKIYGALGHEITLNETNERIEVRDGNILISKVTNIDKSRNGHVGSKNASISFNEKIGTITKNTINGIYGIFTAEIPNKKTYEIADFSNIEKSASYILTVTDKNKIESYTINIVDKYNDKKDTQKAFSFEITDKELIKKTGGVVQGMSGSPIIQNGKIIGAVTNVLVDNVTLGYAISIKTMLAEGEG
jgi:stage IV sporulation protein B